MTKIADMKLYLVSDRKDLCFYWEKYFKDKAVVVNDTIEHFYSVCPDCEGFVFAGRPDHAYVHTDDYEIDPEAVIFDSYWRYPGHDEKLSGKLNDIILQEHHGLLTPGTCICTDIDGRFTKDGKQVYAFYTPGGIGWGHSTDIMLFGMFNIIFKTAEAGLNSFAVGGWGQDGIDKYDQTAAKMIAYVMKQAYVHALSAENAADIEDCFPLAYPIHWTRYQFENYTEAWSCSGEEETGGIKGPGKDGPEKFLMNEMNECTLYQNRKMRILNLHGLYGDAENSAYNELLTLFPESCIESPQIAYEDTDPYDILREYLNKRYDLIVGTSFGGFYAFVLGAVLHVNTVLLNPCVPPHKYIPTLVPDYKYADRLEFVWEKFCRGSRRFTQRGSRGEMRDFEARSIVILGTRDEILDYKLTQEVLPAMKFVKIEKGHRLNDAESKKLLNRCVRHILCESDLYKALIE